MHFPGLLLCIFVTSSPIENVMEFYERADNIDAFVHTHIKSFLLLLFTTFKAFIA